MLRRSFDPETLGGDDIEVDSMSQLWIADYYNHRVRVFTTSGVLVEDLGTAGSGPGEFLLPIGVAVGADGSIYVAEEGNSRIQRFGDVVLDAAPDERDIAGAVPAGLPAMPADGGSRRACTCSTSPIATARASGP